MSDASRLKGIRLFENLSADQLEVIAAKGEIRHYKQGDTIFKEGDPGTHLYCVTEGRVEVSCRLNEDSEQVPVHTCVAGSEFGEFALFENETRSATTRAIKDTTIFYVAADALRELFVAQPAIGYTVMDNLCRILVGRVHKTTRELRSSLMW